MSHVLGNVGGGRSETCPTSMDPTVNRTEGKSGQTLKTYEQGPSLDGCDPCSSIS